MYVRTNRLRNVADAADAAAAGPRLFLTCPMDYKDAEMWFTDLWNYSIVPYLLEAVRDEIQV